MTIALITALLVLIVMFFFALTDVESFIINVHYLLLALHSSNFDDGFRVTTQKMQSTKFLLIVGIVLAIIGIIFIIVDYFRERKAK